MRRRGHRPPLRWLTDGRAQVERTERLGDVQAVGQCVMNTGVTELVVVLVTGAQGQDGMSVGKVLCGRTGVSTRPLTWADTSCDRGAVLTSGRDCH